jgi:uncharacterized membrane protein
MPSLGEWKIIFTVVALIGVLAFTWPSAAMFIHIPSNEQFSELYILGSSGNATDYPFNVSVGSNYLVYVGVGNHLGGSAYYLVEVKLRNSTEEMPNDTSGVASSLVPLYTYRMFLSDNQVLEKSLNFSFTGLAFSGNVSSVGGVFINGVSVASNESTVWDDVNNGYFYQLLMELWLFNSTDNSFSFNSRYVGLWLNLTAAS